MISHDRTNLYNSAQNQLIPCALPHLQKTLALAVFIFHLFFSPATLAAERLVICHGSAASALVPLAKLQGFFAAENLDVELKHLASGFDSLKAMQAGQCAMATAAVPPVVELNLQRNDFRIIAAISLSGSYEKLVAHRDRDIPTVADLRGKRIAVAKATSAHYFNIESTQFDYIWSLHDFSISLDQPLLFSLENVARWNINQRPLTQRPSIPNYLDLIYLDGLKAVRPEATTLIQ